MQARRGFFKKNFFRTTAVVRVSRKLRRGHFKLFGRVAKQTKHIGVGSSKLLVRVIKYLPKYLMFYRNMKAVLVVRTLREIHWVFKVVKDLWIDGKAMNPSLSLQSLFKESPEKKLKRITSLRWSNSGIVGEEHKEVPLFKDSDLDFDFY